MWTRAPIIGTGTAANPLTDPIRVSIHDRPVRYYAAHIPSRPNGRPRFADALVWVPDRFVTDLPLALRTPIPPADARAEVTTRDPRTRPTDAERG